LQEDNTHTDAQKLELTRHKNTCTFFLERVLAEEDEGRSALAQEDVKKTLSEPFYTNLALLHAARAGTRCARPHGPLPVMGVTLELFSPDVAKVVLACTMQRLADLSSG
jgi:hypothetical protein